MTSSSAIHNSCKYLVTTTTPVSNASGRWINLSPWESDEFGIPRAFVRMALDHAALPGDPRMLAIAAGPEFG